MTGTKRQEMSQLPTTNIQNIPFSVSMLKEFFTAPVTGLESPNGRQILFTHVQVKNKQRLESLPDSMKLFTQLRVLVPLLNEGSHLLDFLSPTCLEALGIMKYEVTAREGDLVFDVVVSTLFKVSNFRSPDCAGFHTYFLGWVEDVYLSLGGLLNEFSLFIKNKRFDI